MKVPCAEITQCSFRDNILAAHQDSRKENTYSLSKRNRRIVQARRWKVQLEQAQRRKAMADVPDQLGKVLISWLKLRKSSLQSATYYEYRTCLRKYLLPMLGHLSARNITDEQIDRCLRKVSANQLRLIQSILDQALGDVVTCKSLEARPQEGELPLHKHIHPSWLDGERM